MVFVQYLYTLNENEQYKSHVITTTCMFYEIEKRCITILYMSGI